MQKLQENERLKYELNELQSRLDTLDNPATEELRPEPRLSSDTSHDVVSIRSYTHSSVTSAASDSIDGTS